MGNMGLFWIIFAILDPKKSIQLLPSQGPFYGSEYPFHELENVIVTPHYAGGMGLDGMEEERAERLVEAAHGALHGGLRPLDLSKGY